MNYLQRLSLLLLLLMTGCGHASPDIKGVDFTMWRQDQQGCLGTRSAAIDTLAAQKKLLLGLNEMEIVDILGKPDQQELYKRNQKFYRYMLFPGKQCRPASMPFSQDSLKLVVRFNAVGLAKEITFE